MSKKWNVDPSYSANSIAASAPEGQDNRYFYLKRLKQWRLIVRNLPFTCKSENLYSLFSKFGIIEEMVLPQSKKDPKRGAGFAFVQFRKEECALEAMKSVNATEIEGRPVAVDWAVPKDQYMTAVLEEKERSKREKGQLFPATASPTATKARPKREVTPGTSDSSDVDTDDDNSSANVTIKKKQKRVPKREERVIENTEPDEGVKEGKTIFVRNIPFDVTEDELKKAFIEFGQLKYCVICKYPGTNHSKGSGFVQFADKASADNCLEKESEGGGGISVGGQRLTLCPAISKESARQMEKQKHDHQPKDKRNLHLLRVGLIRGGTLEAAGMSEADKMKRMRIEASNRAKIKDFNIFVSTTRLCIHNIPTNVDNKQLKELCVTAVDDRSARIKECRVMRDLKRPNTQGIGKSRGFAFVEFTEHEHAEKCLKAMNNNPTIFSKEKRPIVEFSLENRRALWTKMQRAEKSKMKAAEEKSTPAASGAAIEKPILKLKRMRGHKKSKLVVPTVASSTHGKTQISNKQKAFPSHFGPKIRHRKRLPPKVPSQSPAVATKKKRVKAKTQSPDVKKRSSSVEKAQKAVVKKKQKRKRLGDSDGDTIPVKRERWFDN